MRRKKGLAAALLCVILTVLIPAAVFAEEGAQNAGYLIIPGSHKLGSFQSGEKAALEIPVKNNTRENKIAIAGVNLKNNTEKYPFMNDTTGAVGTVDKQELNPGEESKIIFKNLTVRPDVSNQAVTLQLEVIFGIAVMDEETQEPVMHENQRVLLPLQIDTIAAEEEDEPVPEPTEDPTQNPDESGFADDGYADGGYSDGGGYIDAGDYSAGGEGGQEGEEKGKGGTPRVIIDGFTTEPAAVNAGDTFKLNLKVRNTSKKTAVGNMVLTLQTPQAGEQETAAEAFLPVEGSNTIFIENIPKDSTKEVSISMTARADLVQKPYPIEAALKYEDENANPFEGTLNISIPVRQKARFDVSRVQVMPESIAVGEEANITFDIYNLGKMKLYNVSVKAEDPSVINGEAFVGNLDAGSTGSVDMMAQGAKETAGDGTVKLIVTYEDQDGNQGTFETSCSLFVTAAAPADDEMFTDEAFAGMEEEEQKANPLIWVGAAAAVCAAAAIIAAVRKKRRKEEEWANEILGSDKDEFK
ncbi:MAG: COG1361 S-layer family protein [Ruminococcus sp.]|jgi:hypothetical protein